MRKKTIAAAVWLCVPVMLCVPAFALEESEVQTAIAASSKESVAGNLFIWFLCAIAFLKIGQKIDSFMAGLGINVGRTGGSMISELLIAGRALGIAAKATGSTIGGVFSKSTNSTSTSVHPTGAAFSGGGRSVFNAIHNAAGNAAAANATGNGSGISNIVAGAVLNSSMKGGGKFASEVIGAVATGNIATVGSITGPRAAQALTSYLGYGAESSTQDVETEPHNSSEPVTAGASGSPKPPREDEITLDGGTAAGATPIPSSPAGGNTSHARPTPRNADEITLNGGTAAGATPISAVPDYGEETSENPIPQAGDEITLDGGTAAGATPIPTAPAGGRPDRASPESSDMTEPGGWSATGRKDRDASSKAASGTAGTGNGRSDNPVSGTGAAATPVGEAPAFRDVEIGGGRITGYETPAEGEEERQFAMYNAAQYMEPAGSFEKIQTTDGQTWYKQVAQPVVQKTPYEESPGKIKFNEKIVEQLPQIPKRKDRV